MKTTFKFGLISSICIIFFFASCKNGEQKNENCNKKNENRNKPRKKPKDLTNDYKIIKWEFNKLGVINGDAYLWNSVIDIEGVGANVYKDYFEDLADRFQRREITNIPPYSANNYYTISFNNFTSAICNDNYEHTHDFILKKYGNYASLGSVTLKPGKMPPPKNDNKQRNPYQPQVDAADNLNILKFNINEEDQNIELTLEGDHKIKAYDIIEEVIDGTPYYTIRLIKATNSAENQFNTVTPVLYDFDRNKHIVILFWPEGHSYNSTSKCYQKHAAIKLN